MKKNFASMMGICLMFLLGTAFSARAAKIGVVDTAKVVKEYEKTKEAQTRLEKEIDDKKVDLKKMSDELEKMKGELETQKGIMSEKKYKDLQKKFDDKQDVFREKYQETQSLLMKKQRTLLEDIVQDVRKIVEDIAQQDKLDLVLDKETVLYSNGQDLTYKVLDKLNAKKK